jgi:hypothetical protein
LIKSTSTTAIAQSVQKVSSDDAAGDNPNELEYEPTTMLMAPPYTCNKIGNQCKSRANYQHYREDADQEH